MTKKTAIDRETTILLALLAGWSILLAFANIRNPLWLDEVIAVNFAQKPFMETMRMIFHDNWLPLHLIYLDAWMFFFGSSDISLRLSALLIYFLNIFSIYYIAGKLFKNKYAGFYSAVFFAASVLAVRHSSNIKAYGILALITNWSVFYFVKIFIEKSKSRAHTAAYIILNVFGTFTHYWFIFALISQGVLSLVFGFRKWKKAIMLHAAAALPFIIIWSGALINRLSEGGVTSWVGFYHNEINRTLDFFTYGAVKRFLAIFIIPFAAAVIYDLVKKKPVKQTVNAYIRLIKEPKIVYFAAFFILPLIFAYYFSMLLQPVFVPERGPLMVAGAFSIILGAPLAVLVKRRFAVPFLVIFMALIYFSFYAGKAPRDHLLKETTKNMAETIQEQDLVLFAGLHRAPVQYYLKKYNIPESAANSWIAVVLKDEEVGAEEKQVHIKDWEAEISPRITEATKSGGDVWFSTGKRENLKKINIRVKSRLGKRFKEKNEYSFNNREIIIYSDEKIDDDFMKKE